MAEAEDKAEIEAQAGAKAEVWLFGSEIVHVFPFFLESPSGELHNCYVSFFHFHPSCPG